MKTIYNIYKITHVYKKRSILDIIIGHPAKKRYSTREYYACTDCLHAAIDYLKTKSISMYIGYTFTKQFVENDVYVREYFGNPYRLVKQTNGGYARVIDIMKGCVLTNDYPK